MTKGRGDKKNWVTSYSVSFSNDTKLWFYYKDANHLEAKVDNSSVSQNYHVSCGEPPKSDNSNKSVAVGLGENIQIKHTSNFKYYFDKMYIFSSISTSVCLLYLFIFYL